jgi:hypothetical protein
MIPGEQSRLICVSFLKLQRLDSEGTFNTNVV